MRYSRFKALNDFGENELRSLQNSTVAVVGLGATGSVIAEHLARHGVKLILIDRDYLEENDIYSSNLYSPEDVKKAYPKAEAAKLKLERFTEVDSHVVHLGRNNLELLDSADIVADGTDNVETRKLIGAWSHDTGTPWIYTAAIADSGQSMFFQDECFNCMVPLEASPESCETAGILREASTMAGTLSAKKAVRYLAGKEVEESLTSVEGENFSYSSQGCEICEGGGLENLDDEKAQINSVCGEDKYQLEIDIEEGELKAIEQSPRVKISNDYLIRLETSEGDITIFRTGRAILEAKSPEHARQRLSELGV